MKKYIHYCWFGGKPLPKLAKKCIKSWKKFLPDFEIIEWNESNVDIHECKFIEQAYQNKKWAFVADYARTKALYEKGGIYFDTDMEITKNIDSLLENKTFLGVEDSGKIAVGVWYENEAKSYLTKKMLKFYRSLPGFDNENPYNYSIPKIITDVIDDDSFVMGKKEIQMLKNGITIYPRDYFYPLSYDRQDNIFTNNTCMIHYYDASWVPKGEKRTNKILRILGREKGLKFISVCSNIKRKIRQLLKLLLFPIVIYKNNKKHKEYINKCQLQIDEALSRIKQKQIIAIYREDWLGTSYATKELFENCVGISVINDKELLNYYTEKLLRKKPKMIIFSAFDLSWCDLIKNIRNIDNKVIIKVLWHGSNAINTEDYDWQVLKTILEFNRFGLINSIGFVKKSMFEFYKTKNYNCEFVMNTVKVSDVKVSKKNSNKKNVKIGVYASGDRWVKNFYNQLSAASMIKNHIIDCIPISNKTVDFANMINANMVGEKKPISREELLKRISQNDINIYVTFVECAPMLPLESFEMGVPCITSDNHHYWKGTELEKYLIVNAPDNIIEIKNRIEFVLKNKEKIMNLYRGWKEEYDKIVENNVKSFIGFGNSNNEKKKS